MGGGGPFDTTPPPSTSFLDVRRLMCFVQFTYYISLVCNSKQNFQFLASELELQHVNV